MESRSRYLADVILCYAVISYVIELFFLLLSLSSLVYHILLTADISPFFISTYLLFTTLFFEQTENG